MKKTPARETPQEKPAGKAKKSSAASTPAKPEKPAAGNVAQPEAKEAPLTQPSPASGLWIDFANSAKKLIDFYRIGKPPPLDYARLREVIGDCFLLLSATARHGDAKAASISLFNATRLGCELLTELSKHEKTREALKAAASPVGDFPVLLSRNPKSFKAAKEYLDLLSVGIKMKDTPEPRYRELAEKFINDIRVFQPVLKVQAMNWKSSSAREQRWHDERLPEANKYPEILDLPEMLDADTCGAWWKVAEKMLKAHWRANPVERDALFDSVRHSAKEDIKTPEFYATRSVKRAFYAMAKQGSQGVESIP